MKNSTRISLVAMVALALSAGTAAADTILWSSPASACVSHTYTGYNRGSGGSVTAGAGTTLLLHCSLPISLHGLYFDKIGLTYKGVGTSSTAYHITVNVVGSNRATGVEGWAGTYTPGSSGGSSTILNITSAAFAAALFDFGTNYYWVDIEITSGTVTGQLETVYGVSVIKS